MQRENRIVPEVVEQRDNGVLGSVLQTYKERSMVASHLLLAVLGKASRQ